MSWFVVFTAAKTPHHDIDDCYVYILAQDIFFVEVLKEKLGS